MTPDQAAAGVRALASGLLRPGGRWVPLAGAQLAAETPDLDVWALTEARSVCLPTKSVFVHNILDNLAGLAARARGATEDQGDLRALAAVTAEEAAQFQTRVSDGVSEFDLMPAQLALAMVLARGRRTALRSEPDRLDIPAPSEPEKTSTFSVLSASPGERGGG